MQSHLSPLFPTSLQPKSFFRLTARRLVLLLVGAASAVAAIPAHASTALKSCTDITKSGYYILYSNVSSAGTCFFIDADNVTLNLNGHTVTYATSGNSRPTPGVVLADSWYTELERPGSTERHGNFEIFNGHIVEGRNGAAKSSAIWVGQSNDITTPKMHGLSLTTYSEDAAPIFGTVSMSGWQIYDNVIYEYATTTSDRDEFTGYAIILGDQTNAPGVIPDHIYQNHILASPQGGIRDVHQNALIDSNEMAFNSYFTNDFCADAPASNQVISNNYCHPKSGRGFHTNSNNVTIDKNNIVVTELPQNAEYNGCELGGTYGVQVEFDTSFLPSPPQNVHVSNNTIHAAAASCDAAGLRLTSMTPGGSVYYSGNNIVTTNTRSSGHDYGISLDADTEGTNDFVFSGNIFNSQFAYVYVDWDGANAVINGGQNFQGSPTYAVYDANGYYDQREGGPTFSQAITVDDSARGQIGCGNYAGGPVRVGATSKTCN